MIVTAVWLAGASDLCKDALEHRQGHDDCHLTLRDGHHPRTAEKGNTSHSSPSQLIAPRALTLPRPLFPILGRGLSGARAQKKVGGMRESSVVFCDADAWSCARRGRRKRRPRRTREQWSEMHERVSPNTATASHNPVRPARVHAVPPPFPCLAKARTPRHPRSTAVSMQHRTM